MNDAFMRNKPDTSIRPGSSDVTAAAPKSGTERGIVVRQVEDRLRQAGGLHDAPDLDRAFLLDELAHGIQQIRGELLIADGVSAIPQFSKVAKRCFQNWE